MFSRGNSIVRQAARQWRRQPLEAITNRRNSSISRTPVGTSDMDGLFEVGGYCEIAVRVLSPAECILAARRTLSSRCFSRRSRRCSRRSSSVSPSIDLQYCQRAA
jgi:hypothetical protein